jgi:Ca2+-binding RTX toxin-like protein
MRRIHAIVPLMALVAPVGAIAVSSAPATAVTTCDGRVPTIVAVAGTPTTGTPGNDVILGTELGDVIDGGAGDDVVCGLDGRDTLIGGPGDDRLLGGLDGEYFPEDSYEGDLLVPGPGDDFVDLGDDPQSGLGSYDGPGEYDRVSYRDAAGPVSVNLSAGTATGEGVDTIVVPLHSGGIIGSAFNDALVGSEVADTIQAGGGDDFVDGRAGDDVLEPDRVGPQSLQAYDRTLAPGDDTVRGGDGSENVFSQLGRDRIYGDDGRDYVEADGRGSKVGGGTGRDFLRGGLAVSIHGGGGNDEIDAVLGRRTRTELDAGGGRGDIVRLVAPESQFAGGTHFAIDVPRESVRVGGRERMVYQRVEDLRFDGPRGRLTYRGSARPDELSVDRALQVTAYGRGGGDVLVGGKRNDFLHGGAGSDTLLGEGGRDRCVAGERVRQCEVRR